MMKQTEPPDQNRSRPFGKIGQPDALRNGDAIEVLLAAKAAGKIRFVGYSGDNERALFAAHHGAFDLIEMSISIGTKNPAHARANLSAMAKGPLAPEVMQQIRSAFQRAAFASGIAWLGEN